MRVSQDDSKSLSYAARKVEHTQFVRNAVDVAAAADTALYVGGYGIMTRATAATSPTARGTPATPRPT